MIRALSLFRRWHRKPQDTQAVFKARYADFKRLLDSNAELLQILSDIEDKLRGESLFGMSYVRSQAARTMFHAARMVQGFHSLSGRKYPILDEILENLRQDINALIGPPLPAGGGDLVLPYERIDRDMVDFVGGKSAHLGELKSRVGAPVPRGFAVTVGGYHLFMERNRLWEQLGKIMQEVDAVDPESIVRASEAIQALFLTSPVPKELSCAIEEAYTRLTAGHTGDALPVALRSSAVGEDSKLTFAGQYLTVLNIQPQRLVTTYKHILASLFTPRAIAYRLTTGIPPEETAMGVACLEMIDALASGVMYTTSPVDPLDNRVLINAVWGLGPYAVDGVVSPDRYQVARGESLRLDALHVSHKPVQLVPGPDGIVEEQPVEEVRTRQACLDEGLILQLAGMGLELERHFGLPQDVEWALDRNGRLFLLQSRTLRLDELSTLEERRNMPPVSGREILLEGGEVASIGVGGGPAWVLRSEDELIDFPENGVLVAAHSSPKFALVLKRAQAVVTDAGSVTGHMASLAREFQVPALLNTKYGTSAIPHGSLVTVDAFTGRVYAGEVPELMALRTTRRGFMKDSPVYQTLYRVAELVVPLNLTDPKAHGFRASNCRTVHDVMRLVHELSYGEMFQISDLVTDRGSLSLRLEATLPIDLFIIDLGGGLTAPPSGKIVRPEQIASIPFKSLLLGLLHTELRSMEPRPVNLRGLLSVMGQQMLTPPEQASERFGDKSYAIISDKYLNFSSRVGYHYSILDAYCGRTVNKNYIHFQFKGGAADDVRRNRRARAITRILEHGGFAVEVTGDRVVARFQKYEAEEIMQRLDMLGRLMIFTRQMDMLMQDEASVDTLARCFLEGDYSLCTRQ